MKIRSTSSSTLKFGCTWPTFAFLAGSVTSIVSFCIFASLTRSSIFFLDSSSTFSISALVSFTSCPTFGLSSGATSFIPFRISVKAPFLPSWLTRTSFSCSSVRLFSICLIASALICANFSFISFLLFYCRTISVCI